MLRLEPTCYSFKSSFLDRFIQQDIAKTLGYFPSVVAQPVIFVYSGDRKVKELVAPRYFHSREKAVEFAKRVADKLIERMKGKCTKFSN